MNPPPLRLYNTLTRRKEEFAPIDPLNVRLYVCGPTVYDFAHIGNARPVIVFDVLFRLLRHLYGAEHVAYVRNITDVDDKINARAARDYPDLPLNEAIAKVTSETERQFREDVEALGALPPTAEPRATQYVDAMRRMIERLLARGVAYVAEGHVLFSPAAMDRLLAAPRYGALARRSLDEMLAGARVDVAPYKRDPMDFVLWKPSKLNEPGWPSPGEIAALGRPGWHIECSAMSMATLLEPFGGGLQCDDPSLNVFDIHGGGIDLVFPHHENEIAQSCTAFGSGRMANVWMHNGFLQVDGEKMAKSAGNFVTIRELLTMGKFGNSTWPGEVLRLAMLRTHYRQPIDWTVRELQRAHDDLSEWYRLVNAETYSNGTIDTGVIDALCDDLNTHGAIVRLHELAAKGDFSNLNASLRFLGFSCDPSKLARRVSVTVGIAGASAVTGVGSVSVSTSASDFSASATSGEPELTRPFVFEAEPASLSIAPSTAIMIVERGDGTYETDAATQKLIVDRIARRNVARTNKDFVEADKIRDELAALGIALKDNKDGTTSWEPKR